MPTVCKLLFANANNVFYGGQLMVGQVKLVLTKTKVLRGKQTYYKRVASGAAHLF